MTDEEFGSLEQQHWTLNDQVCHAIFILIRYVNLQFDTLQMTHFKWTHIALQHSIFLEFQTRVHFCILQEEDDDGNTSPSHLSISATENARDHDSFNFDSGPDYQNKEMALSPTISRPHLKISRSVLFPSRVKMVHLYNLTLLDQLTKQCLILKSQRVFYFIIEMTYNERLSMLDCCLC
jgi:hypothetical protein